MDDLDAEKARELIEQLVDRFPALSNELKNLGISAKKGSVDFTKTLKDLNRDVEKGRASFKQIVNSIESLDDAIDDLGSTTADNAKKSKLLQQREELVKLAANERTKEASIAFGKSLTNGATKLTADLTKSLQSGASGTEVSTILLNSAIDAVTGAVGGLGGFLTSVGKDLAGTKGWGAAIGSVIYVGGKAMQLGAEASAKFLKFSVEVLAKELAKTEKAFNTVNASGAIFADGMSGMREASVGAGLTLEQFSKVISKQSADLAMSGVGVAEGARKVGEVGKIFDQNNGRIREQLQNLGYGFEEQAEITATVMANIRRTAQSVNPAMLAVETQKYAENLRLISALTGEDAKAKTKQVQEQNQIAAFQNEIAKKGPEVAAQIDASMALMSETEKKAFRDRVIYNGSVINQEAAIYEATNRAAADKGRLLYDKFINNMFDPTAVAQANAQYAQAMIGSFRANQALFVGAYATGDSSLQAVSQAGIDVYNQAIKMSKEGVAGVLASLTELKDTQDPLTTGMTGATRAAQEMAVLLEDKLLPLLGTYAQTTEKINAGMAQFLNFITGKGPEPSPVPLPPGFTPPKTIGEAISSPGMAIGGISTGPISGYSEVLHGTEAVVPLPDNKSIPVSLDSSSITASINQQTGVLAEILRAMQSTNSLTSQIAQNSY